MVPTCGEGANAGTAGQVEPTVAMSPCFTDRREENVTVLVLCPRRYDFADSLSLKRPKRHIVVAMGWSGRNNVTGTGSPVPEAEELR